MFCKIYSSLFPRGTTKNYHKSQKKFIGIPVPSLLLHISYLSLFFLLLILSVWIFGFLCTEDISGTMHYRFQIYLMEPAWGSVFPKLKSDFLSFSVVQKDVNSCSIRKSKKIPRYNNFVMHQKIIFNSLRASSKWEFLTTASPQNMAVEESAGWPDLTWHLH